MAVRDDEDGDAREELGSYQKRGKNLSPYRHFQEVKAFEHESEEIRAERKKKNQALLEELKKKAEIVNENGSCSQMRIQGFWFDFYPATDTWFSHAENAYGCSIERLKSMIENKLSEGS